MRQESNREHVSEAPWLRIDALSKSYFGAQVTSLNLLLGREYLGMGDWIMCMSAVRMLNESAPNVKGIWDVTHTPRFLVGLLKAFDVRQSYVTQPDLGRYDQRIPHLVYEPQVFQEKKHMIEGMLDVMRDKLRTEITYVPTTLARVLPIPDSGRFQRLCPYVVLPSCGMPGSEHKEWGRERFEALAASVRNHGYHLLQTGRTGASILTNASEQILPTDFTTLVELLDGADCIVSLENGLSHLAGHLGKRCVTLYLDPLVRPEHAWYPGQLPIVGREITPALVMEAVVKTLELRNKAL
jgi:ADP-heptose:LPS heptosyltransferase